MKKKLTQLRWLVTMLLLVTAMVMPLKAAAQTTITSGDFTYEVISADDKTVGVKSYIGNGGDVAIPQTVSDGTNTYTVTKIMNQVFLNNSALTGISMPGTIIEIGNKAFYSCSNLTGDITINAPIQKIGLSAFNNCNNDRLTLKFTNLQNAYIGGYAFFSCIGLSSLGGTISYIDEAAFARCTKLTGSLTLSADITSIGYYAFDNCNISDITCHASVPPTLGVNCFDSNVNYTIHVPYNTVTNYQSAWAASYSKMDISAIGADPVPSGGITIYAKGETAPYIYAYSGENKLSGAFPGTQMTQWTSVNDEKFWFYNINGYESISYRLNSGSEQSQSGEFTATDNRYHDTAPWDDITDKVINGSGGVDNPEEGGETDEPAPAKDITIYVKGAEAPYIYARIEDESGNRINPAGSFPGTKMTESTTINSENFWYYTISGYSSFNYILNNGNIYGEIKQSETQLATGDRYHGEGTIWADITAQMRPASTDITLAANSGSTDYWGTYSNMSSAARLSTVDGTSLKVYDAKVSGGVLTLTERTGCDVALGEGVLVWSNGAKVRATAITNKLTATVNTDLVATPSVAQTKTADDGYKLYRLTYNDVESKTGLGFYLGLVKDANGTVISDDGKKLKATPGKAYLKVSTEAATKPSNAAPARGFVFPGDDETTGIGEIVIEGDAGISGSTNANDRIYNLQGQQVTAPVKGLYIKNNKKVIIK